MKNYRVEIKALVPYPEIKSYTLTATGAGTAIGRAIRKYRQEIGKKRLYSLTIKCDLLKGIKPNQPISQEADEDGKAGQAEAKKATLTIKPAFNPDDFSNR
jgi:hypothetical protein